MGGEPKDVFCSEPVSIEIREDQIVVMVYKFKGERLLVFGGLIYLILWLFAWNPCNWFELLNIGLPHPWNTPILNGYFRVLLAEVCCLFLMPLWKNYAQKAVLEVIKAEDIPPSL